MKANAILGILFLFHIAGTAWSQEVQIAVVDLKQAMRAHPDLKKIDGLMQTESDNSAKMMETWQKSLQSMDEKKVKLLADGRGPDGRLTQATVSQLAAMERDVANAKRQLFDIQKDTREKLDKIRVDGLLKISEDVQAVVKRVNAGRYLIVLDSSALSFDQFPIVLDASSVIDLTEEVLAGMPK